MRKILLVGLFALLSLLAVPATTLLADTTQQSQVIADGNNGGNKPSGG